MSIEGGMDMLILTRRPRQVVMIGRDVQIMVLEIAGNRVRLGITAPRELRVVRQEHRSHSGAPAQP
jgi:carbon storage regulator